MSDMSGSDMSGSDMSGSDRSGSDRSGSDRSGPPFRADHVGSLLRPPELLRARAEHQAGRLSAEELHRIEDEAIADAVRMQQEIGLQGVTDGEFRRGSWHMDFLYQIGRVVQNYQTL